MIKPLVKQRTPTTNTLDKLTSFIPNGGEVSQYLSKGTIENRHGETPLNDQTIIAQELQPALEHGVKIIDAAKAQWGDQYVEKTLDYIEHSPTDVSTKALMYVSLENALMKDKWNAEADEARAIQKQQDMVRAKSQAYLRQASLAINFGRLRKFAQAGFDLQQVTDKFFSSKEKEKIAKVEKVMQADADTINQVAEEKEAMATASMTPEVEQLVKEGVDKEISKLYEKLPTERRKKQINISLP
jgi:hypothetical protein